MPFTQAQQDAYDAMYSSINSIGMSNIYGNLFVYAAYTTSREDWLTILVNNASSTTDSAIIIRDCAEMALVELHDLAKNWIIANITV